MNALTILTWIGGLVVLSSVFVAGAIVLGYWAWSGWCRMSDRRAAR